MAESTSADTVIVPGRLPVEEPLSGPVRRALLRAHARGAQLVTICSGVFALAGTGLLDGRAATTHWAHAEQRVDAAVNVLEDDGIRSRRRS
ncbi:DJ-1/PfpI family protein [Streptomyces sp. bgisy031]|uniref:DJ-1/PfpI family protein n=1 Tax=Streptomyces sp. bgisy031 TaxID=3413772 RepID=UPI003D75EC7B